MQPTHATSDMGYAEQRLVGRSQLHSLRLTEYPLDH